MGSWYGRGITPMKRARLRLALLCSMVNHKCLRLKQGHFSPSRNQHRRKDTTKTSTPLCYT
jgi:hypothetical protein